MREVNFSIPNGNRASVHITATLYDRRALDCTSTLPLINSLNHLAYLTVSSARIRDILTVDGGVERLVCILKQGRSMDEMHMWKWNLAFQCVVNIGVRGTEPVRTRVVEADMVPVIATILHDYMLVVNKEKERQDPDRQRNPVKIKSNGPRSARLPRDLAQEQTAHTSFLEHQLTNSDPRQPRRQAPPAYLEISRPFTERSSVGESSQTAPLPPPPPPPTVYTSPPERTVFPRPALQHQNRSHDGQEPLSRTLAGPGSEDHHPQTAGFSIRPVRDIDRLPSAVHPLHAGITSNPESPTTPSAPMNQNGILSNAGRRLRRPSVRQQSSSEDVHMGDVGNLTDDNTVEQEVPGAHDRMVPEDGELTPRPQQPENDPETLTISIPNPIPPEHDTVDIAQQTPTAATVLESLMTQAQEENGNSPAVQGQTQTRSPVPTPQNNLSNYFAHNPNTHPAMRNLMPRDDDVLMGLQLLAYISKYCDLRHYFQGTHLVPRLRIDREVDKVYGPSPGCEPMPEPTEDDMEEYLQDDDVNIFPLVEKFTIPRHNKDMHEWACVVMRNLCRKDDARGGIRQCANYKCGKWEDYPRQFAKCRRCKRTKYCSKDCQRDSWSMHRHWCQNTST